MRIVVAVLLAGIGVAVAIAVGSYTTSHTYTNCSNGFASPDYTCTVVSRPSWAVPLGVVIAALGIGAGVAVARSVAPNSAHDATRRF